MEFVCYSEWEQLPAGANTLFKKGEQDSMFFTRPWFENLVNTALKDEQVMVLACVIESDEVLAILPLMKCTNEHWCSLKHRYSSLYSLLLKEKNRQGTLACLAQGLSQLPFQFLDLEPFDEKNSNINDLQTMMESYGFKCHRSYRFYNWIHRVQGQSFAEYMAARPSKVRNTIARKHRKLAREHNYNIRLFKGADVHDAMADYNAIYRVSWKANELFRDVLEGVAVSFSHQNWTRLAILYIEGQPAAAQLWFVVHDKASIFRLAYDEAWKQYSPGSILTKYLMEYVIDTDKVEEIDFLTGNDAYKRDWMSERRERWGMVCKKNHLPEKSYHQFFKLLMNRLKRLKG